MKICFHFPASAVIFAPPATQSVLIEFGEWLCGNVLKKVPHRHFVFSLPKILRIYFLFNRSLLKELSKISWEVIKDYYKSTCRKVESNPAAVAVIQTFGDYLSFNPHMHILAADGCFSEDGFFYAPSINIDTASLEKLFVHRIFKEINHIQVELQNREISLYAGHLLKLPRSQ